MQTVGQLLGRKQLGANAETAELITADRLGVEKAVVVDVRDDHADLVAVAGKHDPQPGIRVFARDHVAVQVSRHAVGEISDISANDVLDRPLVSGGAGRIEQPDEKIAGGSIHEWFRKWSAATCRRLRRRRETPPLVQKSKSGDKSPQSTTSLLRSTVY